MRTKIVFGALLLSVALCSQGFSGECCATGNGMLPGTRLLRQSLWLRGRLRLRAPLVAMTCSMA